MKTLNELTDFLYDVVSGKNDFTFASEDDAKKFDDEGFNILKDSSSDLIIAKTSKLASLNILDKRTNFKIFDSLPKIWSVYQNAAEISIQ